jgi:hypothetical protein
MSESQSPEGPETPEYIKLLNWAVHHIRENWDAIMRTPVLIVFVVVAVVAFYLGTSHSSEKIEIKDERIKLLGDQVSAYKDRLQGATPDEAARRLSILETDLKTANDKLKLVSPDTDRHLTDENKKILLSKIDKLKTLIPELSVYSWSIGDYPEFTTEFTRFFSDNGIKISSGGPIITACYREQQGLLIGLRNPKTPSQAAKDFKQILEDAGLSPHYTTWEMDKTVVTPIDFDLFICG